MAKQPSQQKSVAPPSAEFRKFRRAVAATFFGVGAAFASWAPHIPYVSEKHGLDEAQLGQVLLAMGIGSVLSMVVAGPISARVGPHKVTLWAGLGIGVALTLPVLAPSVPLMVGALVVLGGVIGITDVAMNAVAADVEVRYARPTMSFFHGMFSAGALAGSVVAFLALRAGATPLEHMGAVAVIVTLAYLPSLRALPAPAAAATHDKAGVFKIPTGALLVIGLLVLVALAAEGAVFDWSAKLLRDDLATTGAVAALGYGAFSVTMAAGRFAGDWTNAHIGPVALVRWGAALAALGLGGGLAIGTPASVIAGFIVMGIGLANTVPVMFTAGAARGRTQAEGIAAVAVMGYVGFLVAPPLIGLLANATSLAQALGVVSVALVAVVLTARAVAPRAD